VPAVARIPGERERALVEALGGRSIVLVGMMGAGKSAVGKRLAGRLGLQFRDADIEIEAAAQKSIPEIFGSDGEPFFRDKERRIIARLLDEEHPIVLATGGGAFMNEETRQTIRARGISIWLKAELDVLMRRVRRKANRPLLRTADPQETLRGLMIARYPVYAQADITVMSRDAAHEVILGEVLRALEQHVAAERPR
jgi:shikimate kinase